MIIVAISLVLIVIGLQIVGLIVIKRDEAKKGVLRAAILLVRVYQRLRKRLNSESDESRKRYYEEVFIGEDASGKCIEYEGRNATIALLIILLSSGLYILAFFTGSTTGEYITKLNRPEKGVESLYVEAEVGDSVIDMDISLGERALSDEEIYKQYKSVKDGLSEYILNGNESESLVVTNLRFDGDIAGTGVKAYYGSSDPSVISNSGVVYSETLSEEKLVKVSVNVSYYDIRETLEFEYRVVPKDEYSLWKALIEKEVNESFEADKYEGVVYLPDEVAGEQLRFKKKKANNAEILIFLGVLAAVLMIPYGAEQRKSLKKKRQTELVVDYPEVISKMALLLEAGLTVRGAFERVASDYEKRKNRPVKRKKTVKRYVYEEMLKTRNEISLGIPEQEAYANFGRRCGNLFYIRFSALLAQNVKRGGESLIISLKQEVSEAHREKSAHIKKRGEEIGMKLLIPMMGMFALVMAIIIIPAFLTM